jgi:two-component system, OmpR family, response regulator
MDRIVKMTEIAKAAVVLVVDDDPATRRMIIRFLEEHQLRAVPASGREELKRYFQTSEPSLVILDLRLGKEDGLDLLREIRSSSDVPVIITTGHRLDEIDRVVGLELGADDYILKPFSLRELLARVRAVLRRHELSRTARPAEAAHPRGFRFNGWQLDCESRRLQTPDGVTVPISKNEYALLMAFLQSPQRPLSREHLLQSTRVHEDIFDRSIDVQVLRLRRKLDFDPAAPPMIRTERGVGYTFTPSTKPL